MSRAADETRRRRARRHPRRRSRVAAVQALYRIGLTGDGAEAAISDFEAGAADMPRMDRPFFDALVRGAAARRPAVDPAIAAVLAEGWRFDRLSETMRALLRVAAFELSSARTPTAVAVGEYVDIAAGFFDSAETGFVNGVLDRLAREFRSVDG